MMAELPVEQDPQDDATEIYGESREIRARQETVSELDQAFGPSPDAMAPARGTQAAPQRQSVKQSQSSNQSSSAGAVAKDITRGIVETPTQVVGGAADAVNETSDMAFELASWLNKNVADLGTITIDENGIGWDSGMPDENQLQIPTTPDAKSTTGGLVRNTSKFVTGFFGAGKLKPLKVLQPATKAGQVGAAMAKGAVADFTVFDPHEQRLSNLIQQYPMLQNPVTEFMAASPNDNAAEGRFKNALEGLGLGALTEGVTTGLKMLRKGRIARSLAKAQGAEIDTPRQVSRQEVDALLGDPTSNSLISRKAAKAVSATEGKAGKKAAQTAASDPSGDIGINFNRIETPEDVKKVMQNMADTFKGDINQARRGTRTHAQTKLASDQQDAWDLLLKRRKGEPLNAEQSLAARKLWVSSSEKLQQLAKQAADNPSETNLFAFRKMMATHYAVQKEVIAARTETARALNAWKIPAGGDAELARHIDDMLQNTGGTDVARDMADRIAKLSERGMAQQMDKFINQGAFARTRSAVAQAWINGLLSNPTTHVVNAMSNWSVIYQTIGERKVASMITHALGTQDGVEIGEAAAQVFGLVEGMKDALRVTARGRNALRTASRQVLKGQAKAAKKTLSDSADQFGGVYRALGTGRSGFGMTKLDLPNQGALGSDAWNVASDTWLGRGLDFVDQATQVPGRLLATGDEFFKSIGYRMELHAQALRQASKEVRDGAIKQDQLKTRIAEIIDSPPENVRLAAVDAATYQTFTKKAASMPDSIARAWQSIPVLGRVTLPFRRTPINIMTYTFERTPFAPILKEWKADVAAGGARRDIALARMGAGTGILLASMDMALRGQASGEGPTDPGERANYLREGKQPYSVKVGDRWFSYSRADPIGMTLGLGADLVEIMQNAQEHDQETEKAVTASTLAIAKNVTSKTYLQGISDFFDAVSDPDRYGDQYFNGIAGSLIPAGMAAWSRLEDPHLRTAQDMVDSIKRRTPWWNTDLPLYRDLWGRPVSFASGLGKGYDALSPFYSSQENPEPIDTELERLGYFPASPSRKTTFDGITIDLNKHPEAYSRYVELAGNGMKHPAWGLGAMDLLNAVVEKKHPLSEVYYSEPYTDGPDGGKANFIRKIIRDYRDMAKDQILKEFPEIAAEVSAKKAKQRFWNQ